MAEAPERPAGSGETAVTTPPQNEAVPGWPGAPVAAVLCCWIARGQIQRSEGTLSGSALAGWGIGLTLVFGLNYLAYYASTTFAIRQQAREFTREWLEMLKQGKVDEAFLRMIPP